MLFRSSHTESLLLYFVINDTKIKRLDRLLDKHLSQKRQNNDLIEQEAAGDLTSDEDFTALKEYLKAHCCHNQKEDF